MAELREFGNFYTHIIWLKKGSALFHRAPTHEIEEPYRSGTSLIIRLWPTRVAVVVGRWKDSETNEHDALLRALLGRPYEGEPTELWSDGDDGLTCDCGDGH